MGNSRFYAAFYVCFELLLMLRNSYKIKKKKLLTLSNPLEDCVAFKTIHFEKPEN